MKTLLVAITLSGALALSAAMETHTDLGATNYSDGNADFWSASVHTGTVVSVVRTACASFSPRPDRPLPSAGNDTLDARRFASASAFIQDARTASNSALVIIIR